MGKLSRQKQSRRDLRRPDPAAILRTMTGQLLMGLARVGAMIRVDGEPTPVLEPGPGHRGGMEFDSEVCKAGVKRFARPRVEGDWPSHAEIPAAVDHVLVEEARPGVRRRRPLTVVLDHQMN